MEEGPWPILEGDECESQPSNRLLPLPPLSFQFLYPFTPLPLLYNIFLNTHISTTPILRSFSFLPSSLPPSFPPPHTTTLFQEETSGDHITDAVFFSYLWIPPRRSWLSYDVSLPYPLLCLYH